MAETNLLISIRSCYDQLTRLEKKVADYVLQHPQEVVKMTINELSNSCGVGDTTVFRFCRSMNVGGYQDFKLALALSSNVNDMLDSKGEFNLAQSQDLHELAQQVSGVFTDAVNETLSSLDYDAISRTVEATYLAALPYPGVWSVTGRSLSMVFGTPMKEMDSRRIRAHRESLSTVSMESFPPI